MTDIRQNRRRLKENRQKRDRHDGDGSDRFALRGCFGLNLLEIRELREG